MVIEAKCSECGTRYDSNSIVCCPNCHGVTIVNKNSYKEKALNPLDIQIQGTHYKSYKIQPTEYNQLNKIPWCEANVIKYVTRHRDKNGLEDLKKAKHYIDILITLEYGEVQMERLLVFIVSAIIGSTLGWISAPYVVPYIFRFFN